MTEEEVYDLRYELKNFGWDSYEVERKRFGARFCFNALTAAMYLWGEYVRIELLPGVLFRIGNWIHYRFCDLIHCMQNLIMFGKPVIEIPPEEEEIINKFVSLVVEALVMEVTGVSLEIPDKKRVPIDYINKP